MSSIRFICYFCCRPLKLTQSTETSGLDLSEEPAALKLPSAQQELGDTSEEGSASRMKTDIEELQDRASGCTIPGDGEMSGDGPSNFTLLGKLASGRTLSSIQRATRGLCDILSITYTLKYEEELDHPLCQDCTVSKQLDAKLRISEPESQNYTCCLETRDGLGEDARATLQEVELEEASLVQEVEKNRERALWPWKQPRDRDAGATGKAVSTTGTSVNCNGSNWNYELWSMEDWLWYTQTQMAWLRKTNAFKAMFGICCDGPLAVTNSFRLGCIPTVPVSWSEISAAWGQTALLLMALSNTVSLQFQRYQLIPCRDHSYLKSLTEDPMETIETDSENRHTALMGVG